MRTFIAIRLPQESCEVLGEMQQRLRSSRADVRWTSIQSIHLTLKFLGEVEPVRLPSLAEALRDSTRGESAFSLELRGWGGFPNLRSPRIVWCGIEGEISRLQALRQKVENTCGEFGFPPEVRRFRPHLTLGRVKSKRSLHQLTDCIRMGCDLAHQFVVTGFNIYKSNLSPKGATYEIKERISLPDVT